VEHVGDLRFADLELRRDAERQLRHLRPHPPADGRRRHADADPVAVSEPVAESVTDAEPEPESVAVAVAGSGCGFAGVW
jgi:hypothetical protein